MNTEKGCRTCVHAAESIMKDPCHRCLHQTRAGNEYPEWELREDKPE